MKRSKRRDQQQSDYHDTNDNYTCVYRILTVSVRIQSCQTKIILINLVPGGVGHGPRDQFCPITSLQMADWFFHLCAGSLLDFLRFSPYIKWFTIILFGKVWVDRSSKPQFSKQYDRELKQQRRRRLRKRHLKSKVALLHTVSRLVHLV